MIYTNFCLKSLITFTALKMEQISPVCIFKLFIRLFNNLINNLII